MTGSKVLTSVVKWSKVLSNRVSNFIRSYVDYMIFVARMAVRFIIFFIFFLFYFTTLYIRTVVCSVCCCLILYSMYTDCNVCVLL
jgi:hypothetical protein